MVQFPQANEVSSKGLNLSRAWQTTKRTIAASVLLLLVSTPVHPDLVILQYHHVSSSTPASTSTTPALFRAQLEMIERLGLEVVPLDKGTGDALEGRLDERQQVAITFDDAYSSVWDTAAPILEEFGYPFTVFVNTGAIGRRDYMTWEQLGTWAEKPEVLIANHSEDHGHLPQKPDESNRHWRQRIEASLDKAQAELEKRLGKAPPLFAYPYGEFDDKLEAAIAKRGWLGFGQQSGPVGDTSVATRVPRFPVATSFGQLDTLETKLRSRALPVPGDDLPSGVLEDNPPRLSLTLPDNLDSGRLNCFASGQGRIPVETGAKGRVDVQADNEFSSRRLRYNCTYPLKDGVYYWLSHQWVDLSRPED
ncbi:polysaccharide deacetylase family protein [Marinobacter salicampi]|uniref:polysaccharide deacetylase family protein n=1 Tax=Marinobacter salicampi TaxID=435907 RepID=UPI001409462F|nr:polysaccharide deacetylase family protein [Marinobacter salicampi]